MYQSQYPASYIVGGVERLVIGWSKHFFEGFRPALGFDLVIATGFDQFVRRDWIVLGFEYLIEAAKPPTRVAAHRSGFTGAVTYLLSRPLWLLSLFAVWVLVSAPFAICHP
nr:hypothetical protein [Halobium salinum]